MPRREEITYFGAGPALLPTSVLEIASKALVSAPQSERVLGPRNLIATFLSSKDSKSLYFTIHSVNLDAC